MALNSGIERTEASWNPVNVCSKTSPGCLYSYAEKMAIQRHVFFGQQSLFFFEQRSGVRKKAAGSELDGRLWSEMIFDQGIGAK